MTRRQRNLLLLAGSALLAPIVAVMFLIIAHRLMFPTEQEVGDMYSAAYPARRIRSIDVGEGDSGAAYYHIRYEDPLTSGVGEDVWLLLWQNNQWTVAHRESLARQEP